MFPDALAARVLGKLAGASGNVPCTDGTRDGTMAYLKSNGVDKAVVLNIATNERQQRNVNDFAISLAADPDIIPFGSVYPLGASFEDELYRLHAAGIKGIKLHPEYQDFEVNDKRVFKVYEICGALGLIISFHAGYDNAYLHRMNCPPRGSREIAESFPNNKFVFAHMGGDGVFEDVYEYLAGTACQFDTGFIGKKGIACKALMSRIIKKHGAEKILFATDTPWMSVRESVDVVDSLDITAAEKDLIFDTNARELLAGVNAR
jgi:predicted TIM-barrel fold metal-dependent hydrolase